MIVSEYLQGKMGKREFGKLLDRIAKITVPEKPPTKKGRKRGK